MLRRKPTALTISPEDLSAFEEAHARRIAYTHYRRTGEDPNNYFRESHSHEHTHTQSVSGSGAFGRAQQQQQQQQAQTERGDPSDELKPLPGDKARIVRSREERIGMVGQSGSGGAGAGAAGR